MDTNIGSSLSADKLNVTGTRVLRGKALATLGEQFNMTYAESQNNSKVFITINVYFRDRSLENHPRLAPSANVITINVDFRDRSLWQHKCHSKQAK